MHDTLKNVSLTVSYKLLIVSDAKRVRIPFLFLTLFIFIKFYCLVGFFNLRYTEIDVLQHSTEDTPECRDRIEFDWSTNWILRVNFMR